jgi:hypothetical protein
VLALNAGSQATLVLYGQALDRLQTIAVTPARGALTAQLGPPASTMRTLTLVASSGALGGRYQLTAQAGTTSFILSAAVDVAARPAVAPVLTRLDRTADGYVLVGRGFGTDRSKVVVWEGGVRVSDFAVVGVAPDRITVRSRPTGSVMHRVEVAGVASGSLGVSHSGPVIGSIGVTSAELARILASPKAQTAGAPTPALAPSAPRPAAPQPAVPAAARPGPGGTVAPGSLAPSTPSPSPAAARAGAAAPSVAGAPRATPAPRGQGFAPRSATTSELTMTGLGPPPVVGQ